MSDQDGVISRRQAGAIGGRAPARHPATPPTPRSGRACIPASTSTTPATAHLATTSLGGRSVRRAGRAVWRVGPACCQRSGASRHDDDGVIHVAVEHTPNRRRLRWACARIDLSAWTPGSSGTVAPPRLRIEEAVLDVAAGAPGRLLCDRRARRRRAVPAHDRRAARSRRCERAQPDRATRLHGRSARRRRGRRLLRARACLPDPRRAAPRPPVGAAPGACVQPRPDLSRCGLRRRGSRWSSSTVGSTTRECWTATATSIEIWTLPWRLSSRCAWAGVKRWDARARPPRSSDGCWDNEDGSVVRSDVTDVLWILSHQMTRSSHLSA